MRSRRSVLASLGVLALAGCVGPEAESGAPDDTPTGGGGAGSTPASNETTGDESGESEASADDTSEEPADEPTLESRGPVRAEGDATPSVRVEEDDETVELTADGDVRFVAAWRHANRDEMEAGEPPEREPVYETSEWEHWADIQAVTAAQREASDVAADELGVEGVGGAVSSAISDEEGVDAVVSTSTTLDREGSVVSEPSVSFEELVAAAPRSVEVTYVFEDRTYETAVPIYVRHTVAQYQ